MATTLTALGVKTTPSVAKVVGHVANLATAGEAPPGEILNWLDSRADEEDIALLADLKFLPGRDGGLFTPAEISASPITSSHVFPSLSLASRIQRLLMPSTSRVGQPLNTPCLCCST